MELSHRKILMLRLVQIGVALVPVAIGFLSLLNDTTGFKDTVSSTVLPLLTMHGQTSQTWRALPVSFVNVAYILMFMAEFVVGALALIGVFSMIKNLRKTALDFELSKFWVYLACGWGVVVWGLGFFEGGGDWLLSWKNPNLSSFQSEAVTYVTVLIVVFIYLKLSKN